MAILIALVLLSSFQFFLVLLLVLRNDNSGVQPLCPGLLNSFSILSRFLSQTFVECNEALFLDVNLKTRNRFN